MESAAAALVKEKELHDINEYRIRTLETVLREKETAANAAKEKLIELQVDFTYQLKLLDRCNEELALKDVNFTSLKNVLRDNETKLHKSRKLKKLLREKEKEVNSQRRELIMTFDDVMRQKEMEFKRGNEELQTKMRALELKNAMMVQTTDAQCASIEELKTKNQRLEKMIQENDKEMTLLKTTVAKLKTAKEAKVGELESEVVKLAEVKHQLMGEYESKMAEHFQLVLKAFVQQKAQHDDELRYLLARKQSDMQEVSTRSEAKLKALTVRLRESDEKVEALQAELKDAKWKAGGKLMDTEREIKRVRSTLQELEKRAQTLQEILQESAIEIALLKEKDMTLRQEVMEGVEKQKDLQRELVAVNLRWENRWQEQQQELDKQHELHLRELQQGRDCLCNGKRAVEERLLNAENEVQWLRSELSLLKASAGIKDSFDSQHLASATDLAAKMSFESAPASTSSRWSDDPGTPSSGVSPLITGSSLLQPTTSADTYANALETDSAKLRELIRQMKESLTQEEEMEAISEQAAGSHSASKRAEQLVERGRTLETQLDKNSRPFSSIALQFESCKRELTEAQQSVDTKSRKIVELEFRVQELEEVRAAESQLQSRHAAQLMDLNWKLGSANCDIDCLVRRRCQLMELSNQLHADLRRSGNFTESRSSISRVEFAGKKDYQNLIAELTQSLKEVRVRNKALKKHLRRMVKLQIRLQQKRMSSCVRREGKSERRAYAKYTQQRKV
ncbi:unnamed protein product [Peronospora destructor]|uniref:Uncharacterized protein n=1 Tax=Peronospora destructor TaxID=86335 RepID=A0AAV0T683_9STRA|nr:unnamed protein product [Peronospora destructor]